MKRRKEKKKEKQKKINTLLTTPVIDCSNKFRCAHIKLYFGFCKTFFKLFIISVAIISCPSGEKCSSIKLCLSCN